MSDTTRQDYDADRVAHETTYIEPDAADAMQDVGLKVQTFIAPKDFLPGRDPAWAIQKIAPLPRGQLVELGTLGGVVIGTERKTFKDPDGSTSESVWLKGDFVATAVNPETGEVTTMTSGNAIIPTSMAVKIENAFRQGAEKIMLDLEIGIEATGRMIPYAYRVTFYPDEAAQRAINLIVERQQARSKRKLAKAVEQRLIAAK